ncbi:probable leucine-rich repeat receptor-like serine/threonine-protein kinase At3g14840 isoform X7 [Helianthus annuus]|uniref:probable leucine-rich repeat receptor-like serine/threonine-protein kinase At3g14840 isoform X7 n=1 Tax=Helianthus annuus TaxID=4232 RepID=UPI000B8F629B|nr:probable leucine-rich repeat receptor-like serine/threonine-protein kinase At3g14840 isoform X7 [Helianthus annuus]
MSIIFNKSLELLSTIVLIFLALLLFEVTDVHAQNGYLPQDEVRALRDIAEELGKRDWNFSLNPCDNNPNWATPNNQTETSLYNNTVMCNCSYPGDVCHVITIILEGQDLDGVLPPSLAKLPYIKTIDLGRNYLNGTIPSEWASTKLEYLSVSANRLTGRIPTYLGNITSLVYLSLQNNMFSGTIPAELGKLENLANLRLTGNNFNGRIPSLESWKQLSKLEMIGSGVGGPIPASISLLSNLEELRISDLSGESSPFPNLRNMTNMRNLVLRSCNITGRIPNYIALLPNLKFLDLSFNGLVGDIPDLSGLDDLYTVYFTGNSLNANVPGWLMNTGVAVDLSYNHFSKEPVLQRCPESVNLFRSHANYGNESDLANCFSQFPCSKNYSSVHINCGGTGVIIGDKVYEADDQDPGGPARFRPLNDHWGFSSTGNVWNVKDYRYTINNVSRLTMKDSELYTVARRSPLSITYYGRCLVNGRYKVTLHFAEIVFRDNRSYQSLGRRAFDVYIQGAIELKNFDIKHEAGGVDKAVIKTIENIHVTNKTLEIRFQYAGNGTTAVPRDGVFGPMISAISMEAGRRVNGPDPHVVPPLSLRVKYGSQTKSGKRSIFIVIGAVTAVLLLTLIVIGVAWKRGYIGDKKSREKDIRGIDLQTGVFTYRQIKAATRNFADSNKLGEGGFGSVYMGTLQDGTLIAVKKLSSKSSQGNREFVNEIGMIASIQHPNVVRLHGCCVERNQLLLVYEYMANNSLAHALFDNDKAMMEIDFPTRQRISIGIAKGLKFLHEDSVLRMVHRDIKATNVLLDTDLTPKISDFGLAKLNEEENTHITTTVAGTIGYMAPEYALRGHLSYKADVYSFGVLLLEIIAGKSNMKYHPTEEFICLVDWVVALKQKGCLMDLVDSRLGSDFNKEEALRMIQIALLCINKYPAHRPTMSEVTNMLEGRIKIKKQDINLTTSDDEFRLQALKMKLEEIQTPYFDELESFTNPSSSIHDQYTDSQASEKNLLI